MTRHLYVTEGIDLQKQRDHAERLTSEYEVVLHKHPYGATCGGKEHERYDHVE